MRTLRLSCLLIILVSCGPKNEPLKKMAINDQLILIGKALDAYNGEHNAFPLTLEGLVEDKILSADNLKNPELIPVPMKIQCAYYYLRPIEGEKMLAAEIIPSFPPNWNGGYFYYRTQEGVKNISSEEFKTKRAKAQKLVGSEAP